MASKAKTTMALEEVKALVLFMKEHGVSEFTAQGVTVRFQDSALAGYNTQPASIDDKSNKLQEIRDLVKFANTEEENDLLWSAK